MEDWLFKELAVAACDDELRPWADMAAAIVIGMRTPLTRAHVSEVPATAALLRDAFGGRAKGDAPTSLLAGLPQELVRSEMLAGWAKPWAEELRLDVFGGPEPPFRALDQAVAWIRQEYQASDREDVPAGIMGEWQRRLLSVHDEMRGLGWPRDLPCPGAPGVPTLAFSGQGGWTDRLPALWNPRLRKLALTAERMAQATGWQPAQATAFILTGAPPFMPRLRLRIVPQGMKGPQGQGWLARTWAGIEVHATDVSGADLKAVLKLLRKARVARRRPLRDADRAAYQFVRECRRRRPRPTWAEMLAEWRRSHPETRIGTTRGLQVAVKRAEAKARNEA